MKTDNELIAEFMGVKEQQGFYDSYGQDEPFWYTANEHFRTHSRSIPDLSFDEFMEHCKYHTSWDWLMPVVEKIDSLGYFVTIMKTRTTIAITLNVQNHIQSIHPGYSMIEVVYQAVIQFIKWYNSQNP